ncbi:pectate lyase [Botryobacter ruber]|uniref:pectate lyase n=1 Tax=Botryobacter ruber TaxID=2171629 RepID=UPI000E0BDBDC|nr:pectate lyase [Botryobacter ruber]
MGQQFASFRTYIFFRFSLRPSSFAGAAVVGCLACSIFFTGCTGQAHTATTANQEAVSSTATPAAVTAAEPVSWGRALRQKQEWYAGAEAQRIADNLLLYQRDNGGWDKNTDMATILSDEEKAVLQSKAEKGKISTIDNRSTFTQMEYLAKVYAATGHEKYKEAFLRGMDYLLEAQYENGGWPQFYPIRKGYYEHITFNDGAMIGVMTLLRDVANNEAPYTFVDATRKDKAAKAIEKGLDVILKTQIKVDGRLTAWCAQHDKNTFAPQKARAYELPSISGSESIGILKYLLQVENPGPEVVRAVEGAISWMERVKITGIRLDVIKDPSMYKGYDRVVVKDPAGPPLLARFYEIGTNKPMFVGRDGIVRENLSEIEQERRSGYGWYTEFPQDLVEKVYPAWKQKWMVAK